MLALLIDKMMAGLVALIFFLWAVGATLIYVPALNPLIRALDFLAILPEWRFFAPNPGRGDFFLLYRDKHGDRLSEWREVEIVRHRPFWSALWNPRRREGKALFDASTELGRLERERPDSVLGSIPYLTLLQYVSLVPRLTEGGATQFLLLLDNAGAPQDEPGPFYLSEFHALR